MRKKLLSIFLVLAMVLSLMPATVWAQEEDDDEGEPDLTTQVIARVDGKEGTYDTLQDAVDAAGNTLTLLSSPKDQDTVTISAPITLDLNDKTISFKDNSSLFIRTSVTIDGGPRNAGSIIGGTNACGVYLESGELTLAGGNIVGNAGIVVWGGELIMTGGTVRTNRTGSFRLFGGLYIYAVGILINQTGGPAVTISGGSVRASGTEKALGYTGTGTALVTITGGIFSSDLTDFVSGVWQSVEIIKDYSYTVAMKSGGKVMVTSENTESDTTGELKEYHYETFKAALEATLAGAGDTITLLGYYELSSADGNLLFKKDESSRNSNNIFTVDLNGYTLNLGAGSITVDGVSLSIKNSAEKSSSRVTSTGSQTVIVQNTNGSLTVNENVTIRNEGVYGGIAVSLMANGKLTLSGGAIEAAESGCAIYQPEYSTVTIGSGTLTGGTGIVNQAGEITVSGGTIEATGTGEIYVDSPVPPAGIVIVQPTREVMLTIGDGGKVLARNEDAIVYYIDGTSTTPSPDEVEAHFNITGSIFSSDVNKFLGEGFMAVPRGDGTYEVMLADTSIDPAIAVAMVIHNSNSDPDQPKVKAFPSLQAAISDDKTLDGDIVMLLQDVGSVEDGGTDRILIDKGITLSLNGHTITFKAENTAGEQNLLEISGNVTINGSGKLAQIGVVPGKPVVNITSGTVTIDGPEITGNDNGITVTGSQTVLTVKSGTITGRTNGIYVTGSALTVEGGTITGRENGIYVDNGTLTITGGAIESTYGKPTVYEPDVKGAGIAVPWLGSVTISGTNTTILGPTALYLGNWPTPPTAISGGTFRSNVENGKSVVVDWPGSPGFISGGTYLNNGGTKDPLPGEYLVQNVFQDSDGTVRYTTNPVITIYFDADPGYFENSSRWEVRIVTDDDENATLSADDLAKIPTPTHPSYYEFDGWYILVEGYLCKNQNNGLGDGKCELVDTNTVFRYEDAVGGSITVHAHWTPTHAITFWPDGGNFEDGEPFKTLYAPIGGTLSAEELAKIPEPVLSEYRFDYWFRETMDDDGNPIKERVTTDTIFDGPTEVYPQWTRVVFHIYFDPGIGALDSKDVAKIPMTTGTDGKLTEMPKDLAPVEDPGSGATYTFAGWYTEKDGEGRPVNKDTVFTEADDDDDDGKITVYAYWNQDKPYTITFDPSGGWFEDDEGNIISGMPTRLTDKKEGKLAKSDLDSLKPTRGEEYSFDAWYREPDGKGEKVTTTTVFTKNTTVYAHWIQGACEITFDANGGTFSGDPPWTTVPGNGTLTKEYLESIIPTPPTGKAFAGWFLGDDSGACKETNGITEGKRCTEVIGGETKFTKSTTVHAHWGYEILFYLNDGSSGEDGGTPEPMDKRVTGTDGKLTKADGKKVTDWPVDPELDGYTFAGWYTDSENGDLVDEDEVFNATTKNELYAHWSKVVTVTLKADPEELTVGGSARTVTITLTITDSNGIKFASDVNNIADSFKLSGSAAGTSEITRVRRTGDTTITITLSPFPSTVGDLIIEVPVAAFDDDTDSLTDPSTVTIAVKAAGSGDDNPPGGGEDDPPGGGEDNPPGGGEDNPPGGGEDNPPGGGEDNPPGSGSEDQKDIYEIWVSDSRHGKVYVDSFAAPGTRVTITATPDTDYYTSSVDVRQASGTTVYVSQSGDQYTFTMPSSDVTVSVKFSLQAGYNSFTPPQTSQSQSQSQTFVHTMLPPSAFTPITWRPAAAMWDVPTSSWAYPAAQWAYQNGYLDTAADGTFQLNGTVSHMQLWKIMARWLGVTALDDNSVSQWARQSGAFKVGSGNSAMTRQNMVEYLYQCYFLMGGDVSVTGNLIQYRDSQLITAVSTRNAWLWAVGKGIISGTSDGALNPNGILSRAEFATILMRLCQNG